MAIAIGDVIYAVAKGTFLNEGWNNRFWYIVTNYDNIESPSEAVVDLLWNSVYNIIKQELSQLWTLDEIEAYKWSNPLDDYFVNPTNIFGDETLGQPSQSYVAVSYTTPPGIPSEPTGGKRFGGLTENDINGNTIASLPILDQVGQNLGATAVLGGTAVTPCMALTSSVADVGSGIQPIVTRFVASPWTYKLGTQNSRKPGYGT